MKNRSIILWGEDDLSAIDNIIVEHGYTRLMQIMMGEVPKINSFAILTAENSFGISLDKIKNQKRNNDLKERLDSSGFGYRQIKGKYNNWEDPFFVINIQLKPLLNLGRMFKQDSVIYGEIKKDKEIKFTEFNLYYIDYTAKEREKPEEYILYDDLYKDNVKIVKIVKRYIVINPGNVSADFYSEYKGRKFYIPFFDDEMKDIKFKNNSGIIDIDSETFKKYKEKYKQFWKNEDYSDYISTNINSNYITIKENQVPKNEKCANLLKEIKSFSVGINVNTGGGFCSWGTKKLLLISLNELFKLI
jgi:hypothetical protein